MIPKIIHYCWFGGNPKSKLIKKCMKSWKKYCPDYEIIEWNESNFDLNCCDYVKEAFEAKKWAFVSDYVRIWALNQYGGIYLDTDVEIKKNLDCFLVHSAFTGFERKEFPFTAVFGCEKGYSLTQTIINSYAIRHFILQDNSFDLTTNTETITKLLIEKYNIKLDNSKQQFNDGLVVYPNDYFCPKSYDDNIVYSTENTYAIHWFNASWQSAEIKRKHARQIKEINRINTIHRIKHIPHMIIHRILGDKAYRKLKEKFKR